jgi:hypothetical protein
VGPTAHPQLGFASSCRCVALASAVEVSTRRRRAWMRGTLEAECCCGPGPELGKESVEEPRPVEIGDEPTRGRRAPGDGVRHGCSQVIRAAAGNRGPYRRLRSPDPAVQPSHKSDVVLVVTAARPAHATVVAL